MSIIMKDVSDKSWLKRKVTEKINKPFWEEKSLKAIWARLKQPAKDLVKFTAAVSASIIALTISYITRPYGDYVIDVMMLFGMWVIFVIWAIKNDD